MDQYKSLKDHVYQYIAEQISEGKLSPSQKVNETAISKELSVSRTPVREALIQLSCEDILDNIPRKGFVLKAVTETEAAELYSVIGFLDGMAAQISCNSLSEKDLANMEFHIESMDLAIKANNYEMYLQQQDAFHMVYLEKCNNAVLTNTIYRLKSKFFKRGTLKKSKEENRELLSLTNEEHRKILMLFQEKNKDGLFDYLVNVHWSPSNAHHELF